MFDGDWKAVSGKLGNQTIPLPDTMLKISGEGYVVETPDGQDKGDLKWGPEGDARTIDMIGTAGPHQGSRIEGIVRVKGKFMQLCYAVDGSGRPRSFEAAQGTAVVTVRYRRMDAE